MGTLLIDHWLGDAERIAILDDASMSEVREALRACAATIALPAVASERMVAAASELARNQLAHAVDGVIGLRVVERDGVAGIELIAADHGAGIADPAGALQGTPRSEGSLGVGLSAAARQTDEMDLDIRRGAGMCVRIRTFAGPVRRSEIGIFAQPHPDETVIGDHAVAIRDATGLVLAVADGLGHGPAAREAADRAIDQVSRGRRSIAETFAAAHAAMAGTRGAVMAIAHVDAGVEHAGIGNISTWVIGVDGVARPLGSTSGTLGSAFPKRLRVESVALGAGELLVMSSDGLASRVDLASEPSLVRQHPIVIAQRLLSKFGRGTDDALIAVVR